VSGFGPIIIRLWAQNSSLHSVLAVGQIVLSESSPVLLWENRQEGEGGKRISGFSLTYKAFPYICISPNCGEFFSQVLLQSSAASLQCYLQIPSLLQMLVDFCGEISGSHFWKKNPMLENKTICFSWNQTLYGERPKYWGNIFAIESSEENWYFCAHFFCTQYSVPIVIES